LIIKGEEIMRRSMLAGAILGAAMTVVPTAYANDQEFHARVLRNTRRREGGICHDMARVG
jgi:hypothetical protein